MENAEKNSEANQISLAKDTENDGAVIPDKGTSFEKAINYLLQLNHQKALEAFIQSSQEKNVYSYFYIFLIRYEKIQFYKNYYSRDFQEIEKWGEIIKQFKDYIKLKADLEDKYSLYIITKLFSEGILFPKDERIALNYAMVGSRLGCSFCQNYLAMEYQQMLKNVYDEYHNYSKNIDSNENNIIESYFLNLIDGAAANGNYLAWINKAYFYFYFKKDKNKFVEILNHLISNSVIEAYYMLAKFYEDECKKNFKKLAKFSFIYMQRAAEKGHIMAMKSLANFYETAFGTEKDTKKAFQLYEKLAKLNDEQGLENLAYYYLQGIETRKNDSYADHLFNKAKQLHANSSLIYKINIENDGVVYWVIIKIRRNLRKSFLDILNSNPPLFNYEGFGRVLYSGVGINPNKMILDKVSKQYSKMKNFDFIIQENNSSPALNNVPFIIRKNSYAGSAKNINIHNNLFNNIPNDDRLVTSKTNVDCNNIQKRLSSVDDKTRMNTELNIKDNIECSLSVNKSKKYDKNACKCNIF